MQAIAEQWPEFAGVVRRRLDKGAITYGDASFELPAGKLALEVEQEMLDIVGWGFILWCRLQELKPKLNRLEAVAS